MTWSICIEKSKESILKIRIKEFSKDAAHKINIKNQFYFYTLPINILKMKFKHHFCSSLVAQWVKDPVLPQLWLGLQLQHGFGSLAREFPTCDRCAGRKKSFSGPSVQFTPRQKSSWECFNRNILKMKNYIYTNTNAPLSVTSSGIFFFK